MSDEPDECVVSCVAAGELSVGCAEDWRTLIRCFRDTLTCGEIGVESYAEDLNGRSSASTSSCPAEEEAYNACLDGT